MEIKKKNKFLEIENIKENNKKGKRRRKKIDKDMIDLMGQIMINKITLIKKIKIIRIKMWKKVKNQRKKLKKMTI